MSRWPILLLVLLASALGLAACGGDGGDDDVATILSETFGEGKEVKSGRLDLSFRLNAKGLQGVNGPVGVSLDGPFQSTGGGALPQFDFTAALDVSGTQLKGGAVSTGDKGFLKFQNQAYAVSDEIFKQFRDGYAEQAKCNQENEGGGVSFSSLGVRPARWLANAEKVGEEEVGGTETIRISGDIDVPRFLEDVNRILSRTDPTKADPCAEEDAEQPDAPAAERPRQLSESERKQIADAIKTAKVEIWTGAEDRTMRRVNLTLGFEVPEGEREQANGLQSGDIRFDMTIGALNEKQTIKAPAGARPLEELAAQFGGQVPGVGGGEDPGGPPPGEADGTAAPGAAAPGASGGAAAPAGQYEQCLQAAGSDVAKLQECQQFIGQ